MVRVSLSNFVWFALNSQFLWLRRQFGIYFSAYHVRIFKSLPRPWIGTLWQTHNTHTQIRVDLRIYNINNERTQADRYTVAQHNTRQIPAGPYMDTRRIAVICEFCLIHFQTRTSIDWMTMHRCYELRTAQLYWRHTHTHTHILPTFVRLFAYVYVFMLHSN